ncbi:MAG TPA: hypothetical protein VIV12_21135 [Streptosporangiaceae bacterium]
MPVDAAYEVCIDLTRDRDFSDTNEDVSAYVKALEWTVGATDPFAPIARANTLSLTLRNGDGRFSPERAAGLSGFEPGALARVRVTDPATATAYPMCIGWIEPDGIEVIPGTRGLRETDVHASGFFVRLMDEKARISLQENQRADQIVDALLTRNAVYPPGFTGWFLGEQALGENTYLGAGVSDYASLETGVNTFTMVGDNWGERASIYRALSDIAETERGFIYENREGKLVFYNRHHWYADLANALDATLAQSDMLARRGLDYAYGNVVNDVEVAFRPRRVGSANEVLGLANGTPRVEAADSLEVRIGFDDGSGNRIGGKSVLTPVANTDWTANAAEDGTGTDLTSSVSASMVADGSGVSLTFINSASVAAYLRNVQVRGLKITDFGEQMARYRDDTSIALYGRHPQTITLRILDDFNYAADLAVYEAYLHKDPAGEVRDITFMANKSAALMTYALTSGVGARIALAETQTGLSGQYYVVGETHKVQIGRAHQVTQFLRPAPPQAFWVLGVANFSELDAVTRLGV